MTLIDDTQRKGACDWVSDDCPRSLWYWLTSTYVEAHQSGDIVELIILKLKQLPWVTLVETNMYKLTKFLYAIIWINHSFLTLALVFPTSNIPDQHLGTVEAFSFIQEEVEWANQPRIV